MTYVKDTEASSVSSSSGLTYARGSMPNLGRDVSQRKDRTHQSFSHPSKVLLWGRGCSGGVSPTPTGHVPATSHQPWRPRAPSLPGLLSPSSTPSQPLVCEGGEHPARADHQRVPGLFRHEEAMSGTGSAVCFPVFVLSKSPSTWTPWLAVFTCEAMTLRLAQVWSSEKS